MNGLVYNTNAWFFSVINLLMSCLFSTVLMLASQVFFKGQKDNAMIKQKILYYEIRTVMASSCVHTW